MLTYFCVYFISLAFFGAALHSKNHARLFFYFLSATPLILLGGFRDRSIGADTDFYIWDRFSDAITYKDELLVFLLTSKQEIGYMLLNWGIAQISSSHIVFLTIAQMFVVVPMFITAIHIKKWGSPLWMMFIFLFIQYQYSLSIIRQSIGLSFSLLAFICYYEKKTKYAILCLIIAITFHYSSILSILYPISLWIVSKYPIKYNYRKYILGLMVLFLILISFDNLLSLVVKSGLIDENYSVYSADSDIFEGKIQWSNFVIKIFVLYITYISMTRKSSVSLDFFFIMALLDFCFSLLGAINDQLIRFSYYPRYISFISIPYYLRYHNFVINFPLKPIFIILVVFFWWYTYIWGDYGGVGNYKINTDLLF